MEINKNILVEVGDDILNGVDAIAHFDMQDHLEDNTYVYFHGKLMSEIQTVCFFFVSHLVGDTLRDILESQ